MFLVPTAQVSAVAEISLVGVAENSNDAADVTVTLPGGMLQNDIVVAMAAVPEPSGSDPPLPAGYTNIRLVSTNVRLRACYKFMGASPDASVTFAWSIEDSIGVVVMVFRRVHATPLDVASTFTESAAAAAPDSPSITPLRAKCAIISVGATGQLSDATVTAPAGYGNQVDITRAVGKAITIGAAWKLLPTAVAENPAAWTNWTGSGDGWAAFTIALRPV